MIAIYRGIAKTPFGNFNIAVLSTLESAKIDMRTAIQSATKANHGLLKIESIKKSNRRILLKMDAIKVCTCQSGYWAWIGSKV